MRTDHETKPMCDCNICRAMTACRTQSEGRRAQRDNLWDRLEAAHRRIYDLERELRRRDERHGCRHHDHHGCCDHHEHQCGGRR